MTRCECLALRLQSITLGCPTVQNPPCFLNVPDVSQKVTAIMNCNMMSAVQEERSDNKCVITRLVPTRSHCSPYTVPPRVTFNTNIPYRDTLWPTN
ncbi:unnamed protein product [Ranitomeya imitator]|uniref:Uncharacterized protein n=1 Tax=Ranitomeya imitator TaxID=111125 RepID=A0ABN9L8B7_9NEOB|nr:unnamed protein product [Ranitomeya imitator]